MERLLREGESPMEVSGSTPWAPDAAGERRVLSVSELTRRIRQLLEDQFPFIWVEGEISNFRVPGSGHYYFVLKDASSQIRAVMFRTQQRLLRFRPEDGLHVLCQARVTVYEPRGEYQLLVDFMEPRGLGALQLAYEQLKRRLAAEGLFDEIRKKPLPFLTQRLGVVTSPTGAAIRDIIQVARRRYSNLEIYLYPVRVQGEGSAEEIAAGIRAFNEEFPVDVLIVGRGGGSWEDLWSFNEEVVVRAIYRSRIPVIAAVGHEIDVTLADLVADVRAPTPSAAAELVAQLKESLETRVAEFLRRLEKRVGQILSLARERLESRERRLRHPAVRLADVRLRLDESGQRLEAALRRLIDTRRQRLLRLQGNLMLLSPARTVAVLRASLRQGLANLDFLMWRLLERKRQHLERAAVRLETLSPLAVLARGYSITTSWPEGRLVRSVRQVQRDDRLRIRLHEGSLDCRVTDVHD
jgi:exodeoxyribonuclease VII large subunit